MVAVAWRRDSWETQEVGSLPLDAGTRELVKGQQTKKTQCMCSELQTM
jgi:hypothetical protein